MRSLEKVTASQKSANAKVSYQSGFGNHFATEAESGALPHGQNSPQKAPLGLYAEQLSGTAFTAPRAENLRSWLYRIRPSVLQGKFKRVKNDRFLSRPFSDEFSSPDQLRFNPMVRPKSKVDFIDSLTTFAGNGDQASVRGSAVHLYLATTSMTDRYFYNADGDFLIVPQDGEIVLRTEFGVIELKPGEIAVVPRGIKYQVFISGDYAAGYVLENYGPHFRLPGLGPIGANGLANARDFLAPAAAYEDSQKHARLTSKFQGALYDADLDHSPLDVVAWHGNYYPYKYDLSLFNAINTVSFDHPDPSIFTVLTSPSEIEGVANVDFVIFPPRWMVAEKTFRPPYYHRNIMSEYMGLVYGVYDAKEEGFVPGGGSLHNCMSAHGPDATTFEKASNAELKPAYLGETLAFMFESSLVYRTTRFAIEGGLLQDEYLSCWKNLKRQFKSPDRGNE